MAVLRSDGRLDEWFDREILAGSEIDAEIQEQLESWESTELQVLKALPRNGKPVSEWTNENCAFLDVVQELRRMLDAEREPRTPAKGEAMAKAPPEQAGPRNSKSHHTRANLERKGLPW